MLFPWRFFSFLSTSIAVSGKSIMVQNEISVAWTLHFSLFFSPIYVKMLKSSSYCCKNASKSKSSIYLAYWPCKLFKRGWLALIWDFFFFFIFILKVDCRFPQGVRKDFSVLKSPIFYRLLTKKQLVGASVGAWL